LKDEDRNVRYRAVHALHELGVKAKPAVVTLAEVILDSRELEATRQWAIKTLVVTLPETHDDVVKALVAASGEDANYGVFLP
jgi:HEAT repeat protein